MARQTGIQRALSLLNFLQFFVWGAWMMTLGAYGFGEKGWSGAEFGLVFSTMGFASLVMPTLFGILADKWRVDYVYALLHLCFAAVMCVLPSIESASTFFWVLLLAMCFYMPTLGLNNSLGFLALQREGLDPVKAFPPIRVWGTVGFIVAMWVTNFLTKPWGLGQSIGVSFYSAALFSVVLAVYCLLALPKPEAQDKDKRGEAEAVSLVDRLGLRAFSLLRTPRMALFFLFSLLLGAALQLTNAYGDTFLSDKAVFPEGGLINNFSTIILSISQMSETLFILAIPFFMTRFGIRQVMLISMVAWVLRFGLFAISGDSLVGFSTIIVSCVVYGMAFDFFNISGALFVDANVDERLRSSAQGLFMLMTNGVGAVLGNIVAGYVISAFFEAPDGAKDWTGIWLAFASYALVVTALFVLFFPREQAQSLDRR